MSTMSDATEHTRRSPWRWPVWLACTAFLAIAGFFVAMEHRAHLVGVLPYLLLLSCPVIHLLMHRGHHGHRAHVTSERRPADERSRP